jgi:selenocysteine-specific elongation factor
LQQVVTRPGATRLYIDRVFSLRGIGTVVTGTLWGGSIGEGDLLRAEPAKLDVRVRSVQVHDRPVARAEAGQRVAVGLPGIGRSQLRRGDALIKPRAYPVSYRLDVVLEELEPVPGRVSVHHGTSALAARVARAGERYAQLRLAAPVVAARGDRVVLRTSRTVGGGLVLDPAPRRHSDAARFELLERGDIAATVHEPVRADSLRHLVDGELEGVERAGDWVFSREWLETTRAELDARLAASDPLDPGVPRPHERWARDLLPLLGVELRGAKVYRPGAAGELGERAAAAERLEAELAAAGTSPIRVADRDLAAFLEHRGRLVRTGDGLAVGAEAYEHARALLVEECDRAGRITLARFRDLLGGSRRDAQLLLERFDVDGLTRRVGDARVLRRRARA